MSVQRAVSIEPLTDAECRSLAPARAKRLAYSLAGRARALYELATGAVAIEDGGATALNPQGLMGVDRSGPPWGDAHLHPMWSYGGIAVSLSSIYGAQSLTVGAGTITRIIARFYVRPHSTGQLVPYSRAYLRAIGVRVGASGTATATIRVYGPDGDRGPSTSATVSTTSAAEFGTSAYCLVSPGYNERTVEIENTGSVNIYIGPMSLNQIARRTH